MDVNTELKNEKKADKPNAKTPEELKAQAEKRAAKKAGYKKAAQTILDLLDKKNVTKDVPAEALAFLKDFASYDPDNAQRGSVLGILYPDGVKVGAVVTLGDAMGRTLKGEQTLKHYMKNWAEKGIVVDYVKDKSNPLKSTFTIKALPQA